MRDPRARIDSHTTNNINRGDSTIMQRWFEIQDLRTPFLAINVTNGASSRQVNADLFAKRQTGHWDLPEAATANGVEGQPIVLLYREGSARSVYVGMCKSKRVTDQTGRGRPRYTLTVERPWVKVGETTQTFAAFFEGFRVGSGMAVLWADMNEYAAPAGEIDNGLDGDAGDGVGGYDEVVTGTQRVNHDLFVARLIKIWGRECALTGLKAPRLVQACHLVPWSDATYLEKVNGANGLPLCAHLHALLDSHLLSFDDGGHLLLAQGLDRGVRDLVLAAGKTRLRLPLSPDQQGFLERHRIAARELGKHLEPV